MACFYYKWYWMIDHYNNDDVSTLYNRFDFRNDKFKEKLISGLESLIAPISGVRDSVFKGGSALWALCGLTHPELDCFVDMKLNEESLILLSSMVSLTKYKSFENILPLVIRNRHPFEKSKWRGWGTLARTSEYGEFSEFGEMITSLNVLSLDIHEFLW